MEKNQLPLLGIDLGGTKISAGLILDQKIVGNAVKIPTPDGAENILNALVNLCQKFKQEHLVSGVGIATAGIVDPLTGQVLGATGNLPGWGGTQVKKILQARTGLQVHVENDANAAAYGELRAGKGLSDKTCVVTVTLGTGIGVGIVIEGRVFRGAHFTSQAGHIKVAMGNRRRCTCGLFDCWEAYGCGRGLVVTGLEMLEGIDKETSQLSEKGNALTTQDIAEAAGSGDLLAKRIIEQWHQYIAEGMVSLCHTLDPDVFILTGGLSHLIDYAALQELLIDRTMPRIGQNLEIRPAQLGEAAGMIGAAELVLATVLQGEQVTAS